MKLLSNLVVFVGLLTMVSLEASAAVPPSDKRTILTSGEKVYPIHYQLGQSTVLFFGLRPETVICGNKNYFNIEKIKEGITIQPLSSFSTNLTVLAQGRRYLFFLTPASGKPDGFIEVKWVPPGQTRSVKALAKTDSEVVRELGQKTKIGNTVEFSILREKILDKGKRRIFEVELVNLGGKSILSNQFEVIASLGGVPLARQVVVWESDELKEKGKLRGRVIVSEQDGKSFSLVIGYLGRSTKLIIKGGRN